MGTVCKKFTVGYSGRMSIFRRKKKPLSADVIALLAQAHSIHKAELEFAKDAVRAELRDKVRHALEDMQLRDGKAGTALDSAADIEDKYLVAIGSLFCETHELEREWHNYIRDRRIARNDAKLAVLSQQIDRALGRPDRNRQAPYQPGQRGQTTGGPVVASW